MVLLAGCGSPAASSVSGVVIGLEASSLTRVEQFALRDQAGRVWDFRAAEDALADEGRPLNASHLREHMTFGDEVTVVYRQEGESLVAERVSHD